MRSRSLGLLVLLAAIAPLSSCSLFALTGECASDADCGEDVCDDGACVECVNDRDCDDDDICDDGDCRRPECDEDADCDAGEECDDGRCENGNEGEGEGEGEGEEGEGEGEGEGEPLPEPDPEGPQILQLSTSGTVLFEDGVLIVSVVVTDPDGVDDVIGGSLLRAAGGQTYGTFQTSASEGAYEATLDWGNIENVEPIEFATSDTLTLRAQFFDQAGHVVAQDFTIELQCRSGGSACDGNCDQSRCDGQCTFVTTDEACGSCDVQCSFPRFCGESDENGFICLGEENDEEACSDGQDNDDDGFPDCNDFDCGPVCNPGSPEANNTACSDGIDNDNDSFIDCIDFNCSQNPNVTVCPTDPENSDAVCTDGFSNDGDGFIDCDDFDCSRNIAVGACGIDTCAVGGELGFATGNGVAGESFTGNSRSEGNCGGEGPDRVFRWTAPFDATWTFDAVGSSAPTIIYLRNFCGDQFDVACSNDTAFGSPASVSVFMFANQQIFIGVDTTQLGAGGSFQLNINAF